MNKNQFNELFYNLEKLKSVIFNYDENIYGDGSKSESKINENIYKKINDMVSDEGFFNLLEQKKKKVYLFIIISTLLTLLSFGSIIYVFFIKPPVEKIVEKPVEVIKERIVEKEKIVEKMILILKPEDIVQFTFSGKPYTLSIEDIKERFNILDLQNPSVKIKTLKIKISNVNGINVNMDTDIESLYKPVLEIKNTNTPGSVNSSTGNTISNPPKAQSGGN